MKTIEQVRCEEKYADVFTLDEFCKLIDNNTVSSYDGYGYFHDGEKRTNKKVFDYNLTWDDVKDYPYVVWVNK